MNTNNPTIEAELLEQKTHKNHRFENKKTDLQQNIKGS